MSTAWSLYITIGTVGSLLWCLWLLARNRKRSAPTEGLKTTGHEYDGIEEYDNPLPAWWVGMFAATVLFALGYVIYYPGLGNFAGLGNWTSEGQWRGEVERAQARFGPLYEELAALSPAEVREHTAGRRIGRRLFVNNCAAGVCRANHDGAFAGQEPGCVFANGTETLDDELHAGHVQVALREAVEVASGLGLQVVGERHRRAAEEREAAGPRAALGRVARRAQAVGAHREDQEGAAREQRDRGQAAAGAPQDVAQPQLAHGARGADPRPGHVDQGRAAGGHRPDERQPQHEETQQLITPDDAADVEVAQDDLRDGDAHHPQQRDDQQRVLRGAADSIGISMTSTVTVRTSLQ